MVLRRPISTPYFAARCRSAHYTTPETNLLLNQTTALTNSYRSLALQYGQQWITGTSAQFTFYNSRSYLNSSTPLFNPSLTGYFDLYLTQNLLQGFSLGGQQPRHPVARNNMKVSELQVKLQVATTVAAVLNLYWDLVSFNDAVRIKQQAPWIPPRSSTRATRRGEIGALAGIEVTRAAAGVSAAKEDLLIAQTNVAQQEIVLKNALSRNGIANAWLDDVHIVPLDHIEVPKTEERSARCRN